MKRKIIHKEILKSDCQKISEAFQQQGWNKPVGQYLKYLEYQENDERDILIAELNEEFAGYLTINWESSYRSFQEKHSVSVDSDLFQIRHCP